MAVDLQSPAAPSQSATARLSYQEALRPPCQECDALCCCYLPLQVVPMRSLMEADYVRYLLGFPRVQAGFGVNGQWSMYYAMPCRHFDAQAHACRVHGTWEQPRTCVAYNEHDCWYQRAIGVEPKGFLLFDRGRFERLLDLMAFDRERNIAAVPAWNEMVDLCAQVPLRLSREEVMAGAGYAAPSPLAPASADSSSAKGIAELMQDPCEGCVAPCCRYLYFPLPVPQAFMQIDYLRFCLSFPGIECAASPASWWLVLRGDCDFYQAEAHRCSLYGQPERPLRCAHLNQWDCAQYKQLLGPHAASLHRMDREAFERLASALRFDDQGRIVHFPNLFEA